MDDDFRCYEKAMIPMSFMMITHSTHALVTAGTEYKT
jgi:hypothetical protein